MADINLELIAIAKKEYYLLETRSNDLTNSDTIQELLQIEPYIYCYLLDNYRQQFALIAVKLCGLLIQYVPSPNVNIVVEAIKQSPLSLEFIDLEKYTIPNIIKLLIAAVGKNELAIKFMPPKYQNNEDIMLEAVKKNGEMLEYGNEIQYNARVTRSAVINNPFAIQYVSRECCMNPILMKIAVKAEPTLIDYSAILNHMLIDLIRGTEYEEVFLSNSIVNIFLSAGYEEAIISDNKMQLINPKDLNEVWIDLSNKLKMEDNDQEIDNNQKVEDESKIDNAQEIDNNQKVEDESKIDNSQEIDNNQKVEDELKMDVVENCLIVCDISDDDLLDYLLS